MFTKLRHSQEENSRKVEDKELRDAETSMRHYLDVVDQLTRFLPVINQSLILKQSTLSMLTEKFIWATSMDSYLSFVVKI